MMDDEAKAIKAAITAKYQAARQLQAEGKHEQVEAAFDAAVEAHYQAAGKLLRLGQVEESRNCYLALIGSGRKIDDALHGLGLIAFRQRDIDKAAAYFKAAHMLNPAMVVALTNLAAAYKLKNDFMRCLEASDKAMRLEPENMMAHSCRGSALFGLHRYEEALAEFLLILEHAPESVQALANCAVSLKALDRIEEALPFFEKALAISPDDPLANSNYAAALLKMGDYRRGFERYEWRWDSILIAGRRAFDKPLWLGAEAVAGRTILLHQEQGMGDAIQFSRYVPLVAARGADVVLEVDKALVPLMLQLVGVAGRVVPKGAALPAFDFHCPLMSLPVAFGTTVETVPAATGYLVADQNKAEAWARTLGPRAKPRIGVAWSGRAEYTVDALRSIRLADFLEFDRARYEIISLQKEIRAVDTTALAERDYVNAGALLNDFGDTAALIMELDLVISVDTGVAHLAGALGKEVWILLSTDSDWRWMRKRADSPWYESVRLFRQRRQGDWSTVFEEVGRALTARFGGCKH